MHAGIVLYLSDECPIGFTRVHLAARSSVDSQCFDAAILQLLSQTDNHLVLVVPSEASLHGDGEFHGFHHSSGDVEHQWDILQHTCSCTLSSHFLHGATEVDVEHIGMGCCLHHACCFHHRFHVASIDLHGYGTLLVLHAYLLQGAIHVADQCIGTHKFGIHHLCSKFLAKNSERWVGDIFHRCQKHRLFAKVYISNFHLIFRGLFLFPYCP